MIARAIVGLACLAMTACIAPRIVVDVSGVPPIAQTASDARPVRNVLLLSSGGADGAFGAGLIAGWTASGARPVFDVVTGVSTGALQAPLAFLGPRYDGLLRDVYTTTRTADVLDGNGIGAILKTGLNDIAPLRRRLDAVITDALVEEIAAEHRRGRRLLVATTDLTNGRRAVWDMGAIAASADPARRVRFIGLLLASVTAPGLIEPVVLRRSGARDEAHADGGVLGPILVPADATGMFRGERPTVWIVANGHVSPVAATTASLDSAVAAGRRGVSQLLRRLLYTTIAATTADLRARGIAVRLAALPDAVPEATNPFAFDPREMRGLYDAGYRMGYEGGWTTGPPED